MSRFSQSVAFKWCAEDLVSNADRALMNGHIDGAEYKKIRIMSDEDKLLYLESIVEQFEVHPLLNENDCLEQILFSYQLLYRNSTHYRIQKKSLYHHQ